MLFDSLLRLSSKVILSVALYDNCGILEKFENGALFYFTCRSRLAMPDAAVALLSLATIYSYRLTSS